MSLNWVMRKDDTNPPFILLDNETSHYKCSEEVEIKLKPLQLQNPDVISMKGVIYLTSHRIVVLSTSDSKQTKDNDNFSLLYKDIQTYKLEMPWFGNNKYKILFRISNPDGGLNYLYLWSLLISFPSGGAIQFHNEFSSMKTRVDNDQVDELPAYSEI